MSAYKNYFVKIVIISYYYIIEKKFEIEVIIIMKLFNIQKKFIENKPCEKNIVKGNSNTGKSEAMLQRVLYLMNNFAYEENDRILFVQKGIGLKEKIVARFKKLKETNKYNYFSLLASDVEPEFFDLGELIKKFTKGLRLATMKEKIDILKEGIETLSFKKSRKLSVENIPVIISEIKFMKNNNIMTKEDYMILMGAPLKLRKNSNSRVDMFNLYEFYNNKLKEKSISDDESSVKEAIENILISKDSYVHIFIDNAEKLSKLELEFLLALYEKKSYGTITIGVDVDKSENIYSALVKKGRVYGKKIFGDKKKIYNFKTSIQGLQSNGKVVLEPIKSRESFVFYDLKNRRELKFEKENGGYEEKFIGEDEEEYSNNEMTEIPVFNNIAAGEPILIAPEQEDVFALPKYWVKGSNQKFILHVKGDSMINANIKDGDLVVIEQTNAPMNGDIIAVNIGGNATLKRLKLGDEEVLLMPANEKYEPIKVSKYDEFYVLGKAVGVISKG